MENRWEREEIDLGNIEVGRSYRVKFRSRGKLDIRDIKSSCGCAEAYYSSDAGELVIDYVPQDHSLLEERGMYFAQKYIVVNYVGGDQDILEFSGNVKKADRVK